MSNKYGFLAWTVIATCAAIFGAPCFANAEPPQGWSQKTNKTIRDNSEKLDESEFVAISARLKQALGSEKDRKSRLPQSGLASALSRNSGRRIDLSNLVARSAAMAGRKVSWHEHNGTPISMSGTTSPLQESAATSAKTPSEAAISYIAINKEAFRLSNPVDEL